MPPQVWTKSTQGFSLQRVNEVWGLKTDGQPECLRHPSKVETYTCRPEYTNVVCFKSVVYSKPVDWNMHKISMSCPCVRSLSDFGYCMRWITLISAHGLKINHILPRPMTKGSNSEFFQNWPFFIDLGYCLYDLHDVQDEEIKVTWPPISEIETYQMWKIFIMWEGRKKNIFSSYTVLGNSFHGVASFVIGRQIWNKPLLWIRQFGPASLLLFFDTFFTFAFEGFDGDGEPFCPGQQMVLQPRDSPLLGKGLALLVLVLSEARALAK